MLNTEQETEQQFIKSCSITPNTGKLLQIVVPALGHDMISAFLDLLDNCYDAEATKIKVTINSTKVRKERQPIESYVITDNGVGMDMQTLIESFRFATDTAHSEGDLGKFGIGGTVSIFTLGEKTIKLSRQKDGQLYVGVLDISEGSLQLEEEEPLLLRDPTPDETAMFEKECGDHGTMIIIEKPRKKEYSAARHLSNRLIKELGNSFYQRINEKCTIYVNVPNSQNKDMRSRLVKAKDPLFGDQVVTDKIRSSYSENIEYNGGLIKLRFTEISRANTTDEDRTLAEQGIYWNRNNRLISSGCSHKVLWRKHTTYNCGRIEISFTEDLDSEFAVGALKNSINPSQAVIDILQPSITKFRSQLKRRQISSPLTSDVKSLEKEDNIFTKQLKMGAASIGLPKVDSPNPDKSKVVDIGASKKGGRGPDKQTRVPRSLLTPEFQYIKEPRTMAPWWHEWEEGQMIIYINLSHKFIKDNFVTDDQKLTIRKIVTAQSLAAYELSIYNGPSGRNIGDSINTFLEKVSEKLNAIDKNIK